MIRKSIPSSMNKYNCTAIKYAQLLRIAQHETSQKPSVAYQYTALLFQIAICAYGGRRRLLSRLSSILRVTHAQEIAHCRAYWQS